MSSPTQASEMRSRGVAGSQNASLTQLLLAKDAAACCLSKSLTPRPCARGGLPSNFASNPKPVTPLTLKVSRNLAERMRCCEAQWRCPDTSQPKASEALFTYALRSQERLDQRQFATSTELTMQNVENKVEGPTLTISPPDNSSVSSEPFGSLHLQYLACLAQGVCNRRVAGVSEKDSVRLSVLQ